MPILDELNSYAQRREDAFGLPRVVNPLFSTPGAQPVSYKLQGVKSVTIGPDGTESITFSDKEGRTLATCRSAPLTPGVSSAAGFGTYSLTVDIRAAATPAAPAFIDIHIPIGGSEVTVSALGAGTGSGVLWAPAVGPGGVDLDIQHRSINCPLMTMHPPFPAEAHYRYSCCRLNRRHQPISAAVWRRSSSSAV